MAPLVAGSWEGLKSSKSKDAGRSQSIGKVDKGGNYLLPNTEIQIHHYLTTSLGYHYILHVFSSWPFPKPSISFD